jgi:hypothetical protein
MERSPILVFCAGAAEPPTQKTVLSYFVLNPAFRVKRKKLTKECGAKRRLKLLVGTQNNKF